MLECVINVSEGRRLPVVERIASCAGDHLLDVHSDADHHRSVVTLAGPDVEARAFAVVAEAVRALDLREHQGGVHPRLGVADVVPFVPLPSSRSTMADAVAARDRFAARVARELDVPCFLYGDDRPLPSARRLAFTSLAPDCGPAEPHVSAGACCVGARDVLVAYNVWLAPSVTVDVARSVAAALRGPSVRTLALLMADGSVQVSCNLVDPLSVGPAFVYDAVASRVPVQRAELVGLAPRAVVDAVPAERRVELDVDPSRTIEARLAQAGLDGGSPQ